ncbi:DUF6493 family protein (plasmid) [Streptomyces sp. HUAS 31]|uniref:DUF7824 domain-containing protein n=1 Tax=Streptomyces sp. HUAS 31 TaxID=3020055 RepID=UPI0023060D04|nr:DUF6493 family protein [Streptomyces sp. HUAS 31]WCE02516.1 DUF6493 family protein [Streptomyces sp. HUAS 31]
MAEDTDAYRISSVIEAVRAGEFARIPGMFRDGEFTAAHSEDLLARLELVHRPWPVMNERSERVYCAFMLAVIGACRCDVDGVVRVLDGAWWLWDGEGFGEALVEQLDGWPPDDLIALARALKPLRQYLLPVSALVRAAQKPFDLDDEGAVDWFWCLTMHDTPEAAADALVCSPLAAAALARLPEAERFGHYLAEDASRRDGVGAAALAILARDGHLDRGRLLRAALQGPLLPAPRTQTPGYLALLAALEPTFEEQTAEADTLVALVVSAASSAAVKDALGRIRKLADLGHATDKQVEECLWGLLARQEKNLATAALAFLGSETRRCPARIGELAPLLGEAFCHPSRGVQEKAVKLAGKLADRLDDATLKDLSAAAAQLPSDLRRQADGLLGGPAVEPRPDALCTEPRPDAPRRDSLPRPVPAPAFPPPLTSAQEVAAELGAVLADRVVRPVAIEQVLDGLVRQAHRDRQALAQAVEPVLRSHQRWSHPTSPLTRIWLVAMAVAGRTEDDASAYVCYDQCGHQVFDDAWAARVDEAAHRILEGTSPPFLLATPTRATGSLDPHVLLERLTQYRRMGVRPGVADFDQALFRLVPDPDFGPGTAEELGTPEGRRMARWLAAGGFPTPVCERSVVLPFEIPADPDTAALYPKGWNLAAFAEADWRWREASSFHRGSPPWSRSVKGEYGAGHVEPACIRLSVTVATDRLAEFSAPFRAVGAPREAYQDPCHRASPEFLPWRSMYPLWLTVLPGHPDLVVARTMTAVAVGAERNGRCAAVHLPAVAEAEGEAGPSVHLALAYGTGAASAMERVATADALLALAGRDELRTGRLGRDIAELIGIDGLKLKRVAETLRHVVQAGGPMTVYSVLAEALPDLLPQPGARPRAGLADLLFLAAECAEAAPGRPPVPGVASLAARRGSSQLLAGARALRSATSNPAPT